MKGSIIVNTDLQLKPKYYASVSGGKDSLFMLKLILENPTLYPLDGVIHFELEIDFPFIKDVIDYMETECNKHGIPFYRIKPEKTWFELYNKYGFPTRVARWCNSKYKLNAIKQFEKFLNNNGCYSIQYVGICADEVSRIKNKKNIIYPLVDMGINESVILEWAKNVDLFGDYYRYNNRCGCMFCPMMSIKAMAYLAWKYPRQYREFLNMAANKEKDIENRTGKPFSVFSGNPKYNTAYREKIIAEKYLPKILDNIK